ncbi:hypothetical protein QQX98_007001 [Neonectria punicea]|uniref:Hypervirulence associated protein TUDOR domain-containing protein n=1 Tax=Neonectria punicea TaxID=979145 RepID=A0ABR1GZT0_9HYPO
MAQVSVGSTVGVANGESGRGSQHGVGILTGGVRTEVDSDDEYGLRGSVRRGSVSDEQAKARMDYGKQKHEHEHEHEHDQDRKVTSDKDETGRAITENKKVEERRRGEGTDVKRDGTSGGEVEEER